MKKTIKIMFLIGTFYLFAGCKAAEPNPAIAEPSIQFTLNGQNYLWTEVQYNPYYEAGKKWVPSFLASTDPAIYTLTNATLYLVLGDKSLKIGQTYTSADNNKTSNPSQVFFDINFPTKRYQSKDVFNMTVVSYEASTETLEVSFEGEVYDRSNTKFSLTNGRMKLRFKR
jgi:hypothetical protein